MKKKLIAITGAIVILGSLTFGVQSSLGQSGIPKEAVDAAIAAEKIKIRNIIGAANDAMVMLEQAEAEVDPNNPFPSSLVSNGDYTQFVNVYAPIYGGLTTKIKEKANLLP